LEAIPFFSALAAGGLVIWLGSAVILLVITSLAGATLVLGDLIGYSFMVAFFIGMFIFIAIMEKDSLRKSFYEQKNMIYDEKLNKLRADKVKGDLTASSNPDGWITIANNGGLDLYYKDGK
jgi:hypothetical protein